MFEDYLSSGAKRVPKLEASQVSLEYFVVLCRKCEHLHSLVFGIFTKEGISNSIDVASYVEQQLQPWLLQAGYLLQIVKKEVESQSSVDAYTTCLS